MAKAAEIVSLDKAREAQREATGSTPEVDDLTDDETELLDLLAHCGAADDGLEASVWTVNDERRVVLCGVCEDEDGDETLEPIAVLLTGSETMEPPDSIEAR